MNGRLTGRTRGARLIRLAVPVVVLLGAAANQAGAQVVEGDPTTHDFGYVRIDSGDPSGTGVVITLTNTDPDNDSSALVCSWTTGAHFNDTGCDGAVVPSSGGTVQLVITALPVGFGSQADALTIQYNDSPPTQLEVLVSAEAPELWVSPGVNGYSFPATVVGTEPPPQQTFTVTNDDSTSHLLNAIGQSGVECDSFLVSPVSSPDLDAGSSTTFTVAFDPATTGPLACDLTVDAEAWHTPATTFSVGGYGLAEAPLFADGFESHDTTAWSATFP